VSRAAALVAVVACSSKAAAPPDPPLDPPTPTTPRAGSATAGSASPSHGNTLRGTLLVHGKPQAMIPIEVCAASHLTLDDTLCARAPWRRRTRTDANGRFEITDLPDEAPAVTILLVPYDTLTFQPDAFRGTLDLGVHEIARGSGTPPHDPIAPRAGDNSVVGRLVDGVAPLALVALELCAVRQQRLDDETRCAFDGGRLATRTDASGRFAFEHVPDGDSQIIVMEKPWYVNPPIVVDGLRDRARRDIGTNDRGWPPRR
jgi:hypothetical protein